MSTFSVREHQLTVTPHPGADRLDLVTPDGTLYQAVAQKGRFKTGDRAIYVPEGGVVPEQVLKATGFWDEEKARGMLAGSKGDRVKAIKLRGVLSQGILIAPADARALCNATGTTVPADGEDWGLALGIAKYLPPIPRELSGQVYPADGLRGYTDIENAKNYPGVFFTDEPVSVSEKLHGTCTVMSLLRDEQTGEWTLHVSSKGQASKGLALVESEHNVYWRSARDNDLAAKLADLAERYKAEREVTLFGETLGVQDLNYGLTGGQVAFRAFDLRVDGAWLDAHAFAYIADEYKIPRVPVLYLGAFDEQTIWELAAGKTTAMTAEGKAHIREGVVVRPLVERTDPKLGRVMLKFVSEQYLTRKGGSELE